MSFVFVANHDELYDLVLKRRAAKINQAQLNFAGEMQAANDVQYVDPDELPEI